MRYICIYKIYINCEVFASAATWCEILNYLGLRSKYLTIGDQIYIYIPLHAIYLCAAILQAFISLIVNYGDGFEAFLCEISAAACEFVHLTKMD